MSQNVLVTSRDNRHVKRLDALLRHKKVREESGEFALEGVRLCLDALERGIVPACVLITPSALERNHALEGLLKVAEIVWLDENLALRLGDTKTSQGVFCICQTPSLTPEDVPVYGNGRYLLLYDVRDPGNLGAILRTAAALGADGAYLSGCAELFSPKVLRASMGGVWRMPVALCPDIPEKIQEMRGAGVRVYAAALQADAKGPGCLAGSQGCAILIGNEGNGLPRDIINLCDAPLTIPMRGGSESLNAAVACGILLWEMLGKQL